MSAALSRPVLVTGAAGFIGSHLTDRLLGMGCEVVGLDNLSSGDEDNLTWAMRSPRFCFVKGDLLDSETTVRALGQSDVVFHLAADPEVRVGAQNPSQHFRQNLEATYRLLEAVRKRGVRTRLVFASTSTVYGEASVIPTPEDYGPMLPISTYGATKLGCEALCASYTQLLPLKVSIFRFANVVGSRARHGVILDFIMKLQKNPRELEVLGDGTQTKSYLHVGDCVDAFVMTLEDDFWDKVVDVYNIGSEEQTNVLAIAKIVTDALRLENVTVRTTGGRAWPGDIKTMRLDIVKMKRLGWKPKLRSEEAVRLAVGEMLRESSPIK